MPTSNANNTSTLFALQFQVRVGSFRLAIFINVAGIAGVVEEVASSSMEGHEGAS